MVVKVGTALLTNEENRLNEPFMRSLVDQLAALHEKGIRLALVTSGSVASGRSELVLKKETHNIPYRQALSAVGQSILMRKYHDLFAGRKISVAQALLTELDFRDRESFLNARGTLDLLLQLRVLPIVNENDVVSYAGLKFGGNDWLAAKLAAMIRADALVILTDVDGLYSDDPRKNFAAQKIEEVRTYSDEIFEIAKNTSSSKSVGGMMSKVGAAQFASAAGIHTLVVRGTDPDVLVRATSGQDFSGTVFYPTTRKVSGSKRGWLRSHLKKDACVIIDDGAAAALQKGKSLLPVGVKSVHGIFFRGDVVAVKNLKGETVALGQINYGSEDVEMIRGLQTAEMKKILAGALVEDELMHRDNMLV